MEDAFPIAAAGTAASGAVLHLHTQAVRVRCKECGAESEVAPNRLVCALCDNWRTRLISGDELMLERVCLHETNTLKDNEGTGTHV
jgi:hydrogenase nickel incorporation protein HypA/HybF